MSGFLSLAIAVYEQTRGKQVRAKFFWWIAAAAILFGCFQARQDEHRNSEHLRIEKANLSGEVNVCSFEGRLKDKDLTDLRHQSIKVEEFASPNRITIDSQQQILSRQSVQIGQCLIDEGKLNPAISTVYKVLPIPLFDDSQGRRAPGQGYPFLMLVEVNRQATPYGLVDCKENFVPVTPPAISASSTDRMIEGFDEAPEPVTPHSYKFRVKGSSQWEDGNPIHLMVRGSTSVLGICSYTPTP